MKTCQAHTIDDSIKLLECSTASLRLLAATVCQRHADETHSSIPAATAITVPASSYHDSSSNVTSVRHHGSKRPADFLRGSPASSSYSSQDIDATSADVFAARVRKRARHNWVDRLKDNMESLGDKVCVVCRFATGKDEQHALYQCPFAQRRCLFCLDSAHHARNCPIKKDKLMTMKPGTSVCYTCLFPLSIDEVPFHDGDLSNCRNRDGRKDRVKFLAWYIFRCKPEMLTCLEPILTPIYFSDRGFGIGGLVGSEKNPYNTKAP
ncbi:hypothetical protein DM01DRAFT_1336226 [Hesseltinella vesiculosa]|uniref:Uncharacterized protein n=1 Tax=Hesseltinella vesiculosa TaxID=101127 RepID=A0A1X2GHD5_9FUNG|nr:hypothetical protein DM01DRAFT_1336226 [Hesseltinella vesiculosa]